MELYLVTVMKMIFKTIAEKGFYKPAYSDKEPATQTLLKLGIINWRDDYRGLVFTDYGKEFYNNQKLDE